jgi:hypothetical protein
MIANELDAPYFLSARLLTGTHHKAREESKKIPVLG